MTASAGLSGAKDMGHHRSRPHRSQTAIKAGWHAAGLPDESHLRLGAPFKNGRRVRLQRWVHSYNCHRHHTAVGGPPASRAHNLTRTDT